MDAGVMPWMERVGVMFEIVLGRVVHQKLEDEETLESPEQVQEFINLSRELARHRQLSQEAARWREKQLEKQQQLPQGRDEQILRAREKALSLLTQNLSLVGLEAMLTQGMTPDQRQGFQKRIAEMTRDCMQDPSDPGFAEPCQDPAPGKSDSIQPDPT